MEHLDLKMFMTKNIDRMIYLSEKSSSTFIFRESGRKRFLENCEYWIEDKL
jgi:hypothetical protein